ncbi:MAG: hypothetical protein IPM18_15365 [Phycisphaerales bacterium]|nr:hypothetical protein [Phycisphaerales bacterium]
MKKTAYMLRCLPRCGFDHTEVRMVDLDLTPHADVEVVREALTLFFAVRGISEAVYAVDFDHDGPYAIINDEAYEHAWGTPLF